MSGNQDQCCLHQAFSWVSTARRADTGTDTGLQGGDACGLAQRSSPASSHVARHTEQPWADLQAQLQRATNCHQNLLWPVINYDRLVDVSQGNSNDHILHNIFKKNSLQNMTNVVKNVSNKKCGRILRAQQTAVVGSMLF